MRYMYAMKSRVVNARSPLTTSGGSAWRTASCAAVLPIAVAATKTARYFFIETTPNQYQNHEYITLHLPPGHCDVPLM